MADPLNNYPYLPADFNPLRPADQDAAYAITMQRLASGPEFYAALRVMVGNVGKELAVATVFAGKGIRDADHFALVCALAARAERELAACN